MLALQALYATTNAAFQMSDRALALRFAAAAQLEQQLAQHGDRQQLLHALHKRRTQQYDGFVDHMLTELFITGLSLMDSIAVIC